ncbi:MAG: hypothetical protein JNL80_03690 [Phycisphaerae bacterium]|jgi:hypothetical protein|nr:hypothetical protein [Phycisphaerae bacterium]
MRRILVPSQFTTPSVTAMNSLFAGVAAALLASVASAQCGSAPSCYSAHDTPGCNDVNCCELVCYEDPYCCNNEWDELCVGEAKDMCTPPTIVGGPVLNPLNGHKYWITSPSGRAAVAGLLASQGLNLVTISSGTENEWMRRALLVGGSNPLSAAFIGLNDLTNEGVFVWDDGSPLSYLHWAPGEPNNFGNEDAVEMGAGSGLWNDISKLAFLPGVGERSIATCGSGGSCFSTHGPGCDDETCCNQVCTIDTFCCNNSWDSICVNEANQYCTAQLVSTGIVNPATRSRYFLVSKTSWLSAERLALSMGGNLVSLETAAENEWTRANFTTFAEVTSAWIGLHDQRYENAFEWTDLTPTEYTNWNRGEPNNANNEDFGMMIFNGAAEGKWNDSTSTFLTHAIIEVPCAGDLDGTGSTNGSDLAVLLGAWGQPGTIADLNHDATVDAADLAILLGSWGPCPSSNACFAHLTVGSDQPGCSACVCELDPFCCNNQWDSICAGEAANQCNFACQCGG